MFSALRSRVVLALTLAFISISVMPGTALANPTCDSSTPALGDTVSCTYPDGGAFTLTVPANTIRIDVQVRGGGGGAGGTTVSYPGYRGGWGAQVEASLLPSSSTALTIVVGNGGQPKGDLKGGTGGEFSAVYEGPTRNAASVILVAGGGGGGGYGTRCYGGGGGQGGRGDAGAGGSGDDTDAPGSGGGNDGLGGGGLGGVVPSPLTGTPGLAGSAWSAGGAGGVGAGGVGASDRGGNGGDGYGGGGGGGFVATASSMNCDSGGVRATNDGSGGGAGGSFANADRLIRDTTASFSSAGGSGGGGTGSYWYPYGMNGTVTLTFVGTTYTVTYDGNGATGGTVPTDHWGPYLESTIVTVCDDHRTDLNCYVPNAERMTRDGYTFDGWNTARNGSGTSYAPTNTFAINANTILYAQWKALPSAANTAPNTLATQNTPTATPTLRTTKPKTTATGVTVTFTAPGPGTATASGTASQATRASVTVCSGTTKILKAGKALVTCRLNATGRRLRAKGTLTVTLTTTFVAKTSTRLQATHTVVLPRRG